MRREDMIRIFEDTMLLCDTNESLKNKINYSMNHNRVISDENEYDIFKNLIHGHETGKEAKIIVSKKRSFEAASAYKGKHISVLNFASATNPGGGVTKGASAQEECLCRISTLYKCISASEITEAFHKKHRYALKTGKMNSLYNDDCIQTCDVTVFKSDTAKPALLSEKDWFDVDVISCAAPNLRYMLQYDKNWKKTVTDKKLFDIYKKRINRVLDIASSAKSDVIILGAFGCGAFANPPELVAKAMHAAIDEHKYDFEGYFNKLMMEIRQDVDKTFVNKPIIRKRLYELVDEVDFIINSCEVPGVPDNWLKLK
ncbi:MAG: TIGR02452 family protein [Mediterraneibacter faecis]